MAYDAEQAQILRDLLEGHVGISEKKMFGGLCFMLNGNMLCGVHARGGMFRVGKAQEAEALRLPHARPMDFTGRKMGGFISAEDAVFEDTAAVQPLLALALSYVSEMPAK